MIVSENHPSVKREGGLTKVYYPWKKIWVSLPSLKTFEKERLARNRNLISEDEQNILKKLSIAVAGLNVGNPAVVCLALEGIGTNLKFADNDVLDLSNFNRFRASLADLGLNKAVLSARQVYEINPFLKIEIFEEGINDQNISQFLLKSKVDILIEETDDLVLKIKIRELARAESIPVIMVTGNGEDIILDIERFDLDKKLSLLNGLLSKELIEKIKKTDFSKTTMKEKAVLARDFMGSAFLQKKMRDSFDLVGKSLAGIPQLAEASFLRGAAVCYAVRQIALKKKSASGRYFLKLSDIFEK